MNSVFKIQALVIFFVLSFGAGAGVPAARADREDVLKFRLGDLPVSAVARQILKTSSWWARQTVGSIVGMDPAERRTAVAPHPWLERELTRALKPFELRLSLTRDEVRGYVEAGRAPVTSFHSRLEVVPINPNILATVRSAGCRTVGDLRERLLLAIVHGAPPLTGVEARELRRLRHFALGSGEEILTADEHRFATALADARLGQRARHFVLEHQILTLDDLSAQPLDRLAARSQLDKKTVKQLRSLLHDRCGEALGPKS